MPSPPSSPPSPWRAVDLTALQPFLVIGTLAIIGGGVVAAVTRPLEWEQGSWVAAYLVLVVGVGQIGLATGQAMLAEQPPSRRRRSLQVAALDGGSALVIAGTLTTTPAVVSIGGAVLLVGLIAFAVRQGVHDTTRAWPARLYTLLLAVLIVSTPIGLVLAWVRS